MDLGCNCHEFLVLHNSNNTCGLPCFLVSQELFSPHYGGTSRQECLLDMASLGGKKLA